MGDLVPLFPEGQPIGENLNRDFLNLDVPARIEVSTPTCGGVMHVFDTVPGHCQCGAEFWRPDGVLEPGTVEGVFGVHYIAS